MSISGAEIIIQVLEQAGVRVVAGVPGGALLPLYEALGRSRLIRHVLARHEQAAGFIAQGMARISGQAGVCFATSGPGVTNVVTALADAKLDSVPLLCLAGQVATHLIGTDAFQEVPTCDMVRSITKACYFVRSATQLRDVLLEGIRVAEQGRPGPVLIDIPKDVQLQRITECLPAHIAPQALPLFCAHDSDQAYSRAASMIRSARRPLLYLGGGVVKARAQLIARTLVEQTGIPVTTSLMGLGILPRDHALNLGMLGMHGARHTNLAIEAADLLIAIGTRFDDRATGDPKKFAANAEIIHIDIDARELGKIKRPALAICDDANTALVKLHRRLHEHACSERKEWQAYLRRLKEALPLQMPRRDAICSPYGIMHALGRCLPKNAIVTTDVGQHQMWAAQALPIHCAERWLTSGGLGTMGFGLPAAIGAALACPEAPVFCITGDGSLLMNIQELATLAELELNIKLVLLDNAALGLVRQQQELFYQRRFVASRFERATDFVAIARAFGIDAYDLGPHPETAQHLDDVLVKRGAALIRVPIDERDLVLPMVPSGANNAEPIDHPPNEESLRDDEALAGV